VGLLDRENPWDLPVLVDLWVLVCSSMNTAGGNMNILYLNYKIVVLLDILSYKSPHK